MRADPARPTRHAGGRIRWPRDPRTVDLGRVWGWHDPATGHISVSTDQSAPDQARVLLHELVHSVRPEWAERRVEETERMLLDLLSRNPGPVLWALWELTRG
mgnify:CR=1 FL=1